jgi:arylformamidase
MEAQMDTLEVRRTIAAAPGAYTRRVARLTVAFGFVTGFAVAAGAQDWRTYATVQNPARFAIDWRAFYQRAAALTAEARRTLPHELDLAYGADPKQRLDLYLPPSRPTRAPVFLFIHGGGFREGDRAQYGFVATPLARRGVITAVMSYRLHPHIYPAQITDVELALAWLHAHVGERGGDPARLFVGGHSAGAILSGLLGVRTDWQALRGLPADVIKGIVPVSGPYDLRGLTGFVADFIPTDGPDRAAASPLLRIVRTPAAVVAYGGKETSYAEGSIAFAETLRARGGRAEVVALDGFAHDQTALALGDESSPLTHAVITLLTGTR